MSQEESRQQIQNVTIPQHELYEWFTNNRSSSISIELGTTSSQLLGQQIKNVCDRLDQIKDLLTSVILKNRVQIDSSMVLGYIVQQLELSSLWTLQSPLAYPDVNVFVTQINNDILEKPLLVDASIAFDDAYTVSVVFNEGQCKGFVSLH